MLIFSDKAIFKDTYIDDTSTDMNEFRPRTGRKSYLGPGKQRKESGKKKQKQPAISIMTFASSSTFFCFMDGRDLIIWLVLHPVPWGLFPLLTLPHGFSIQNKDHAKRKIQSHESYCKRAK
jgi:hypothetical protein